MSHVNNITYIRNALAAEHTDVFDHMLRARQEMAKSDKDGKEAFVRDLSNVEDKQTFLVHLK